MYIRKLAVLLVCVVFGSTTSIVVAADFTDGFEGSTLDPFWSIINDADSGTVELSTEMAHSGSQSVKITATAPQTSNVGLHHVFSPPTYGTASVWFFDAGADEPPHTYSNILNGPTSPPTAAGFRGEDFGANGPGGFYRINQFGHAHPNDGFTTVDRTQEWHYFEIRSLPGDTRMTIGDSIGNTVVVYSGTDSIPFDEVLFSLAAGVGSVPFSAYWDDFSFKPVPEPSSMLLMALGLVGIAGLLRKR